MLIGVILCILVTIMIFIIYEYNKFINLKHKLAHSKSSIDVYLNQRFDLIPNLVECVKGYSKHEKEIFENIVNLRTQYMKNKNTNLKQAEELNNGINKIIINCKKRQVCRAC